MAKKAKRIETIEDLMEISGTAAAELGKKPKPSKPSKISQKSKPTKKKKIDDREDWIDMTSPHTGDTMRVRPDRVDYFLSMDWATEEIVKEVIFPKLEGLPTNTHLWYWAKKEPSDIASRPSVNYYFRSLEMAQYVSDNFDTEHKNIHCYPIIDITGCIWWMVHFYNHNKPLEEIHDWCMKNSEEYEAGSFLSEVREISASKGWKKSINNFSEFKKQFTFKETKDKKGKVVYYVIEKGFRSGYGYQATALDQKTCEWELHRCFESRTRRTYISDDGKYALVVHNMDWTRFYHLNKIIPTEHGAWTCLDGHGYPGAVTILFDKESRRDIVLKALKQWYG